MQDPTTTGAPPPIAYFSEALEGTAVRLAAAVIWRGVPARTALSGGGGPLGWLRSLRHRLWLRLGPLGVDVSVAGRSPFGGGAWASRSVSSFALEPEGEPLAYYDDGTRTLRVLGRVLPAAPPGQTLVALVDATGRRATRPRLVLRVLTTPTIEVEPLEPEEPATSDAHRALIIYDHPAWAAALRADPVVGAFLDGHAPP